MAERPLNLTVPANSNGSQPASPADPTKPAPERPVIATPIEGPQKKKNKLFKSLNIEGKSAANYIITDVLKPVIMDGLYDFGTGALGLLIYKDPNAFRRARGLSRTRGVLGSIQSPLDFAAMSRAPKRSPIVPQNYSAIRPSVGISALAEVNRFDSWQKAYSVLKYLQDICLQEHKCRVSDFFKICGKVADYTYDDWGWDSLDTAFISRSGDEYYVELPKPRQFV